MEQFGSHDLSKLRLHGWIHLFTIGERRVWVGPNGELEYTHNALLKAHWTANAYVCSTQWRPRKLHA